MILFVASSIYLPGIFIKPQYNFLYVVGDSYFDGQMYSVEHGKLIKNQIEIPDNQKNNPARVDPKIYIYDVATNESHEISFELGQNLNLDPRSKSPDGFEIVYGTRSDGFFPFFLWTETDRNAQYIKGHNVSKKLGLQLNGSAYYVNARFLSWVI